MAVKHQPTHKAKKVQMVQVEITDSRSDDKKEKKPSAGPSKKISTAKVVPVTTAKIEEWVEEDEPLKRAKVVKNQGLPKLKDAQRESFKLKDFLKRLK